MALHREGLCMYGKKNDVFLKPDSSGRVSLKRLCKKDLPSYMQVYIDGDKIILEPVSEEIEKILIEKK